MDTIKLYEELKLLTEHVYDIYNKRIPKGWQLVTSNLVNSTGFKGGIYIQRDENIVAVVYAGTDTIKKLNLSNINEFRKDVQNDIQMLLKKIPTQLREAVDLYNWAKIHFPKSRIILAGHSLGGSLVQLVSAETGTKGVTFNAFGTGQILENEGYKNWRHINVDNIGNMTDRVFKQNFDKQAGATYVLDDTLNKKEIRDVILNSKNIATLRDKHPVETMPPLKNATQIKPVEKLPRLPLVPKWLAERNLDANAKETYKYYINQLKDEVKQEQERQKCERERLENDLVNQVRSLCSQSKANIKMQLKTASGRIENFQSKYIPPQAKQIWRQHFQINGNSTQDIIRQLKNYIK